MVVYNQFSHGGSMKSVNFKASDRSFMNLEIYVWIHYP